MKHFLIVNPHSFHNRDSLKEMIAEINEHFSAYKKDDYQIHISRRSRDAIAAIRSYMHTVPLGEIARIYAVGGDGLLFDCLNGMAKYPNAELSCVPYGRANDFIRSFGEDAIAAFRDIKSLATGPALPVDVINCGSNFALNQASVGLSGEAVMIANSFFQVKTARWVRPITSSVYKISAVFALKNQEILRQRYQIELDDRDMSGQYSNIHIANIALDGGSFVPSPYAMPDDGVLDVIFTTTSNPLKLLALFSDRNNGRFEKSDNFIYKRCSSMSIKSEVPLSIHLDGEAFYSQELDLKIIPGGVKFFTPMGMKFANYSDKAYSKGRAKK